MPDGLDCGNHHARVHAEDDERDDDVDRRSASTKNVTDLRRARQRARRVLGELEDEVNEFLEENDIERYGRSDSEAQRLNEAITRLAATKLSNDLVQWLEQRRQQTMGRAVRASMDRIQSELGERVADSFSDFSPAEQSLNRAITQVDAGLLAGTEAVGDADDSLANEIGNDITRQIRLGLSQNEQVRSPDPDELDIETRVAMVLNDGDHDLRDEAGVSGQTKRTKAELISHDSIQQAYTSAATRRYLNNGFRFLIYDAVCDFVTSDLCRRLGECEGPPVVIDVTKTPWLIPPNHPWCRSGVRPTLNREGRAVVTKDDISDDYLQTVMSTEQYRPSVMNPEQELNRTALQRVAEGQPGGEA